MVVVLPAPLTPASMMTKGLWLLACRGTSSGFKTANSSAFRADLSALVSSKFSRLTRFFKLSNSLCVAVTPISLVSKIVSNSSYVSASILPPPNSALSCPPSCWRVLAKPCFRRCPQVNSFLGSVVTASAMAGAASVAEVTTSAGFFLKSLNIACLKKFD